MTAGHEAAHQVAARCIPGAGGAVDWLCEGIAEYVGEQVVLETYPGTEAGAVPCFSQHMRVCQDLLDAGSLPTSTDIFTGHLGGLDDGSKYAIYWAFFRYLNDPSQRDRTQKLIAHIRQMPWRPDGAERIVDVVDSLWGTDGQMAITAGFQKYVAAFAPQWSYWGGRLEVSGTTWTQVGTMKARAIAVRCSRAGQTNYSIRGAVEILPRGDMIADVRLGETTAGCVDVGFEAGQGVGLWVDDGRVGDRGPPEVFESDLRPVVGRRMEFAIEATSDRIRVYLEGSQVLEWNPRGRDMTGPWGVDCTNFSGSKTRTNSAAIWYDVRLQ